MIEQPREQASEQLLVALLERLNTVVWEWQPDGTFVAHGKPAQWFAQLYPQLRAPYQRACLQKEIPFLGNFLVDAEDFWQQATTEVLKSGPWTEVDSVGQEYYLEATAVRLNEHKLLLLEFPHVTYEEKQSLIQRARDNKLHYYQTQKEVQRKEILLHCIIHDLSGPLTAIKGCFSLLELEENLTPDAQELVTLGQRQVKKQEDMIRDILIAYASDIASLEEFSFNPQNAPDIRQLLLDVSRALQPAFAQEGVQLQVAMEDDRDWLVVGELSYLERIISNLLENALRHSPMGGTVKISCRQEQELIVVYIDDEGSGVPVELIGNLFQRFSQGEGRIGKAGLGLYFCRMMIERWGGKIGYAPLPTGGSRFWFRLLRPSVYQATR
jgi:signal transduction histidine kinase